MASNSTKWNFHWNYSKGAILTRKGFGRDLNTEFAREVLKYSVPYTPMDSGKLRSAATVENSDGNSGKIQYPGLKYTDYQYYANDSSWNRHTEGTTSSWCEYAWNQHKTQIVGAVSAYRRWHSK